ncbi:hypothetical protein VNI00_014996 [Paramarasmius palmivorus]|uniref:Uncharacterized protein n=1 Tax=Paramarasmius palmivorus TaxID=297713 RepID=A0AAW0BNY9_9AGAR
MQYAQAESQYRWERRRKWHLYQPYNGSIIGLMEKRGEQKQRGEDDEGFLETNWFWLERSSIEGLPNNSLVKFKWHTDTRKLSLSQQEVYESADWPQPTANWHHISHVLTRWAQQERRLDKCLDPMDWLLVKDRVVKILDSGQWQNDGVFMCDPIEEFEEEEEGERQRLKKPKIQQTLKNRRRGTRNNIKPLEFVEVVSTM